MTYQLSYDDLILGQLPRLNIADFDDAQFLKEPRLRLLQTSFHVLRRTKDEWARNGLLGQAAQQAAGDRPRSYLSELLANARLPRNTLHAHHISQIELAITYARRLVDLVDQVGSAHSVAQQPVDAPLLWCDLAGVELGTRVHLDRHNLWMYRSYHPIHEASRPLSRIGLLTPKNRTVAITVTLWHLPIHGEQAYHRALEAAELGCWALRQPPYMPPMRSVDRTIQQ